MTQGQTVGAQALAVLPRNEKALQRRVTEWLTQRGIFFENRAPGPFVSTGVPDITGTYLGRSFAIELKHPREHGPRHDDKRWPAQKRYLVNVYSAGGFALATNDYSAVTYLFRTIRAVTDPFGNSSVIASYQEVWA
jgi:hypothetical protein